MSAAKRKLKGALKSKTLWANVIGMILSAILEALTGGVSSNPMETVGCFGLGNGVLRFLTDCALEDKAD